MVAWAFGIGRTTPTSAPPEKKHHTLNNTPTQIFPLPGHNFASSYSSSYSSFSNHECNLSQVVALSGCAHAKPGLVSGGLPALLPLLYAQTAVREDLIRVVDLGPFKHRVGGGAGGGGGGG